MEDKELKVNQAGCQVGDKDRKVEAVGDHKEEIARDQVKIVGDGIQEEDCQLLMDTVDLLVVVVMEIVDKELHLLEL